MIDRGQFSLSLTALTARETCLPINPTASMSSVQNHPDKNVTRVQLTQNVVLSELTAPERIDLEQLLTVVDCQKGECLLHQGDLEMEQYFILDGILKRVVANQQGKQMILRFADECNLETSYAAWRLKTPAPYSIIAVTRVRCARQQICILGRWLRRLRHAE